MSWERGGYWCPCLVVTFSHQAMALFPTPSAALNGTYYGSGYPIHATCRKDRAYLKDMNKRLEQANPYRRFTVRLQKLSWGFGRTAYGLEGGTLGQLLKSEYWMNLKLEHKPWHVSL